jgi:tetratricopeptide (TPR) repeat protein
MICELCGREDTTGRPECPSCGGTLRKSPGESSVTLPPASDSAIGRTAVTEVAERTVRMDAVKTELGPQEVTGSVLIGTGPGTGGSSASVATGELRLGTVFGGRYEILSILGQGGMGRVYKARDRELDKLIALKTIRLDTADGPEALARFKQELVLARKVTHKNVVRIFDLGEAEGLKFFTMAYIEGDSLKAVIRRRGALPPAEVIALSRQILGALAEAHAEGIVHRDLKPQNVMVDGAGNAHLMDFGIARATDTTGMTATGAVVGTPDYMSPEQVKGEKAGPGSDLFSFGVILYEMLTGALPYQGDSPISKVMMRLSHRPRPVREISKDVPKYLDAIVRRCLEIDPALRYGSARDVLGDLDRESTGRSLGLRVSRGMRRRRGLIAGASVAAVAMAALTWALATRTRPVPPPAGPPPGPVHTLAILPFTNATGAKDLEWMRSGLADMLVTDLAQSSYVRPVPSERVLSVLGELGAAEQTRFDEAALESVSKRAPAQNVLHGQYVASGGRLRLDLTLRKAGSGVTAPLKAEAAVGDVFALVDQLSGEIRRELALTPDQIRADVARPFAQVATSSVDALRAYQEGLLQTRLGERQAAIPLFRDATTKDPAFAMAWARLAEAYSEAGEQREAEAASGQATSAGAKAPLPAAQRYQIQAIAAVVKEDLDAAAKSYEEIAKLYPQDPDAHYRVASTLRQLGHQAEAIAAYERVLKLSPAYAAAEIEMAGVCWQAGRYDDAIRTLEKGLTGKRFGDDAEALGTVHSILGVSYRDSSQLDKSLEHLKLSLDYRRKAGDRRGQVTTLTNLASVHEYRDEIPKALAAEREALRLAREMRDRARESTVLLNLGLTYRVSGDLDRALAAFRESMQIERERENAAELANRLDKIADVYREKGRYDDALVYLEQARAELAKTEAKEEKAINQHYLGMVRKAQGLYDRALEAFLAALPLFQEIHQDMGTAMVHMELGEIYASQGRYADAYTSLQKSLELNAAVQSKHDIAEVKAALGHLLVRLGRYDEAEKELQEAEAIAGHGHSGGALPEVRLARAEALLARGRTAEAASALEETAALADQAGHREVAVGTQLALGKALLAQGRTQEAAASLQRVRDAAARARLRPLEAAALVGVAQAQLARGRAEAARASALDAISLAEKFEGRPVLAEARAALARALDRLGRGAEATDAWSRAIADFDWIRGSLKPEHVDAFMGRRDVQVFLAESLARLDKAGRSSEASSLRPFVRKG